MEVEGFVGGTPGYAAGQLDGRAVNEGWASIGRANGTAGSGPFPEGARSVFAWPENARAGALFRFEVLRTRHQAPPPPPFPPPSYQSDTPRPSPCTKWTHRVPHPVLIGHAASFTPRQARWGLYRAFPHVRHAPRVVSGVQVAPRLARVRAGGRHPAAGRAAARPRYGRGGGRDVPGAPPRPLVLSGHAASLTPC